MGICPFCSASTFLWSLSTQVTLCPTSAKHAPVTRPTYPEPIIEISMILLRRSSPFFYAGSRFCPVELLANGASEVFFERYTKMRQLFQSECDEEFQTLFSGAVILSVEAHGGSPTA